MISNILSGPSIAARSINTGGRSTGFDYLRLLLATSVIAWHAFGISYGELYTFTVLSGPFRPLVTCILPLFFALSGFLVAGSLYRTRAISTFVGLRALRILPALSVEVILSALVLGPVLTRFPLSSYFRDPVFFRYFLNIVGDIHFRLPGLFAANPIPDVVNGQLWTVPRELQCYLVLTIFALLRITNYRVLCLVLVVFATIAFFVAKMIIGHGHVEFGHSVPGVILVLSFLSAIVIYQFRDEIIWSPFLALGSVVLMVTCLSRPDLEYFVGFPAAYLAIYIGLLNPKKIFLIQGADYSYGLYLYGFVIQQSVAQLGQWTHHWYLNLTATLALASLFAAFSWNFVERPALGLKTYLPMVETALARLQSAVLDRKRAFR